MKKTTTRIIAAWVTAFVLLCPLARGQNNYEKNLQVVQGLAPNELWKNFAMITTIPRCSGNESQIAEKIVTIAREYGLTTSKDSANNVIVYLPASPGYEKNPPLCLQAHIDMVCQKRTTNDPADYSVEFIKKGDTLKANETTLGADNGVGLAALLTIMQSGDRLKHPALELLFTAGEESGFIGAKKFDYRKIRSRRILNVDSEEDGTITIGCAGGAVMETIILPQFSPVKASYGEYILRVYGLKGGHSGGDINLGRGNAIKLMKELLCNLDQFDVDLGKISGGSAINTIPRECEARIYFSEEKEATIERFIARAEKQFRLRFPSDQITLSIVPASDTWANKTLSWESKHQLLDVLDLLPNGVLRMEKTTEPLVRTSNNIGLVSFTGDTLAIRMLFRSSSGSQIDSVQKIVEDICRNNNKTSMLLRLPPWEPNFETSLVKSSTLDYKTLTGKFPRISVTHGGLEAAVIAEKLPGSEIISFGPTIQNAHTPDELVNIHSVQNFWLFLKTLLLK